MAVLGLRFRARAFSSCSKWGPLFIAVRRPLTIAASLVAEHRLQTHRLSNCGSRARLLRGMWDLPRPGLKPVSPASAGRLSTTVPPGKPHHFHSYSFFFLSTPHTGLFQVHDLFFCLFRCALEVSSECFISVIVSVSLRICLDYYYNSCLFLDILIFFIVIFLVSFKSLNTFKMVDLMSLIIIPRDGFFQTLFSCKWACFFVCFAQTGHFECNAVSVLRI